MAGRPRQFDIDAAIDAVLPLFVERGYEGASFGDLIKAIGINPPSFYAAFGNKEGLFRQVLGRYIAGARTAIREAMAEPTAREAVRHLLIGYVNAVTANETGRGCLLVQGALATTNSSVHLRDYLSEQREATTTAIALRLLQAAQSNDRTFPGEPYAVARLISMVITGIATQAASGVTKRELLEAVEVLIAQFE
ncbi:TetR/AcrR family transcriptional regulator [Pseudomonas sp. WHRI 8519]|uniref:TetR/AcrR family transcriptional regulator n=1 Tax=Pseudomonas sp. WHRI 8519 TaxID=3162567 RepID=UPI0032F08C1D